MAAQPVEWVLTIYYGPSAHRATYGRLDGDDTRYTKDYIQLSRKAEFLDTVSRLFPAEGGSSEVAVPLTYQWPKGTAPGTFVFNSSDRPHLKWGTRLGAPKAWKMALAPSEATAETIPGNPSHMDFSAAENELELLASRGAGQPYLMAIKLLNEPRTLHLRTYLKNPSKAYSWASLDLAPKEIQALAAKTSKQSALAWSLFRSGGLAPSAKIADSVSRLAASKDWTAVIDALDIDAGRTLARYLRRPGYGLFFNPSRNHDAWLQPPRLSSQITASIDELLRMLGAQFPASPQGDATAETLEADPDEVKVFREQIKQKSYAVPDSTVTTKTRGSAQKAFADRVKANYGYQCAITGSTTKDFLVASHIVPWSKDQSIRLDPSNGICLSLLVDRAFENGFLQIDTDLTIHIDWDRVGDDQVLRSQFELYDGRRVSAPSKQAPRPEYLRRKRALVAQTGRRTSRTNGIK